MLKKIDDMLTEKVKEFYKSLIDFVEIPVINVYENPFYGFVRNFKQEHNELRFDFGNTMKILLKGINYPFIDSVKSYYKIEVYLVETTQQNPNIENYKKVEDFYICYKQGQITLNDMKKDFVNELYILGMHFFTILQKELIEKNEV